MSWLMPAFVVVSTLGAANGCLFSSARLAYAAGRDQHFPSVLGFINIRWLTPVPATLFTIIIALILIIPGDLGLLIDIFIFASWLFYGWTTLSLLILRYREPNLPRPYKVPIVVPIIVLLACVYLLLAPIIRDPAGSGSYTLLFLVIGLIVYVPAVAMNIRIPVQLTTFLQKLLYIVPSVNSNADSDKTEH
ncbi:hypothetical protein C0Q70_18531 [Pomacea canaliculata]|uniref:Amino acid permease/ SLC12A domain-containing protein n=1 Tax=Pomacea canaliculata TaxID=400727 RepID=A0A2T7NGS0_POMCA|nr:hypothetical protein C0Q70_18531 [Pomacea canaliculata]